LFYEASGAGKPLVLVHGSWTDHRSWDRIVPGLSAEFEVVSYDRRGHSQSERPAGQGSVDEDADDLAALIDALKLGPAHVVANSYGAIVALHAAIRRPDVFATLAAHEPPLLSTLTGTPYEPVIGEVGRRVGRVTEVLKAGDDAAGAKLFVDTIARRPGAWDGELTDQLRSVFVRNAPTFLDETRDPAGQTLDLARLRAFDRPALLTKGTESPPFLIEAADRVAAQLPTFALETVEGADHAPHETTPERYTELIIQFVHAALEEPLLGPGIGQFQRARVGGPRVGLATQASQQVGPG
jgi:pimeloyl-ACP methyl ester carboxylesterase